jgi:outer membrane lipoprotein-sorting protein
MDERTRARTLTRLAEEAIPDGVDLWPGIHAKIVDSNQARRPTQSAAPIRLPRRRVLLSGIAAAAVLVLAPAGLIAWWSQPASVSAETILDRAQATAEAPVETRSYHLKMTRTRANVVVESEVWFGGSTKQRGIDRNPATGGSTETIFNGDHAWIILTDNEHTRAVHTIGTAWNKPGDDPSRRASLADVLASYRSDKACLDARQDGEATVAGRPTYVIVTTAKSEGCAASDKGGPDDRNRALLGEMRVWVDKEAFVLLKSETHDASGGLLERGEVTSVEYNVTIPDSLFTYVPPPGVQMREFDGATPDVVKRALFDENEIKDAKTAPAKKP